MQNQTEAILSDFYTILNNQRANFKKKSMYRDNISELAVQNLLGKYAVVSQGNIDYLVYEHEQLARGNSFTTQEIKENFNKALDDMVNGPYKVKLLTGNLCSHIAFGLIQLGNKGEIFKIGALITKKQLALEGIIFCNSQSESGFIFGGRVLDISKKPLIFVLNRGSQIQIVVGTNRIIYNQESGEFRIQLPENYQGLNVGESLSSQQCVIEIFTTDSNDNVNYCQGQDLPNNFNQFQNLEIGLSDIISDVNNIEQRQLSLSTAFSSQTLFQQKQSNTNAAPVSTVSKFNRSTTIAPSSGPMVRTTRAQQIREQAALSKNQPANGINSNNNVNRQSQNSQLTTPTFNKSQTFTVGFNNKQNATPTFRYVPNNNQPQNENMNPNNNQPNKPLQFQFNSTGENQTNNSSQGFRVSFQNNSQLNKFNNSQQQNQQGYNNFTTSQSTAFQPTNQFPKFQISQPLQQQQNNQSQWQNNSQSQQNNRQQTSNIQWPSINGTNDNLSRQTTQNVQWPTNSNSNNNNTSAFRPTYQSQNNNGQQTNQTLVIQPTLKFANQQSYQQNQQQFQQSQNNQQQQTLDQTNKNNLVFSQLSLIDQETLKGYLKELQDILNSEQIQKITALMLTDPLKFYQYYQIAQQQFEQTKQLSGSGINNQTTSIQKPNDEKESKRLRDFDDLTLFLMILPQSLIKNNELKYEVLIKQIKNGEIKPKKLLKQLIIRKKYPINESFKGLIDNKQHSDMVFLLRNEEFMCHQIVFASTSEYFKRAIKDSEKINRYQCGYEGRIQSKLLVPDWVDLTAFKLFLLFMYTGKIGKNGNYSQLTNQDLLNLLRIGNFFFLEYLQEQLIAEVIIPNMSPQSAVIFLKECTSDNKHHKQSCLTAWEFLKHYSQFYLQKHLPVLLRTNPALLYELEISVMRQIIDKSLVYLIDGSKDLETILQFTADTWAEKSICKLFRKSQQSMDSCSAFDCQIIQKMPDFLKSLDPKMDYKCMLIKSDEEDNISSKNLVGSKKHKDSLASTENDNKLNSTFIQGNEKDDNQIKSDIDLNSWKPKSNVLKDNFTSRDIFDSNEPQFQTNIDLNNIKADFEKNKGTTAMSKSFDFGRRSWHLKIDIDYENNLSLWLVERGAPVSQNQNELQIGQSVPIKFSSVIVQFELLDAAFGEYQSLVFYTFAHDTNQVIGHKNFINLSQLKDKSEINLRINMKEFLLHSALIHYISSNFSDLYIHDMKIIEHVRKLDHNEPNKNIYYTSIAGKNDYEVLSLPFYSVFQILNSNELKVYEENTILGFLFHYTQLQSLTFGGTSQDNMSLIVNMLSQPLRFYYLSTKKILSALRDNEFLRSSQLFFSRTAEEFNARINCSNHLVVNISTSSKSNQAKCLVNPRKYYDLSKVQGRKKALMMSQNNLGNKDNQPFIQELLDWLQNSKHQKDHKGGQNNYLQIQKQQYQEESRKWQSLYYEERSKNIALQQQFQQKIQQQQKQSPSQYQRYRRSFSADKQQVFFDAQDAPKAYNNPVANDPIYNQQPKNQVPAFLRQRQQSPQQQQNNRQYQQQSRRNNNSFDQSRYMMVQNDSLRVLNTSYIQADQKVKSNQNADFSQLLANLNKSNQEQNNNYVPYYKRNKFGTKSSQESECYIF